MNHINIHKVSSINDVKQFLKIFEPHPPIVKTLYHQGFSIVVRKSLTVIYGRPLNIAEGVHDEGLPSPGSALEPSDRVAI